MSRHRRQLGPPSALSRVRPRRMLRRLAEQARDEALPRDVAPGDPFVRARRALAVLLPRRSFRRVTITASSSLLRAGRDRAARTRSIADAAPCRPPAHAG